MDKGVCGDCCCEQCCNCEFPNCCGNCPNTSGMAWFCYILTTLAILFALFITIPSAICAPQYNHTTSTMMYPCQNASSIWVPNWGVDNLTFALLNILSVAVAIILLFFFCIECAMNCFAYHHPSYYVVMA